MGNSNQSDGELELLANSTDSIRPRVRKMLVALNNSEFCSYFLSMVNWKDFTKLLRPIKSVSLEKHKNECAGMQTHSCLFSVVCSVLLLDCIKLLSAVC